MNARRTSRLTLALTLIVPLSGCSQFSRVLYRAPRTAPFRPSRETNVSRSRVMLAAFSDPAPKHIENEAKSKPNEAKAEPIKVDDPTPKPSTGDEHDSDDPKGAVAALTRTYTAPGIPYQQLAMAVTSAVVAAVSSMADAEEVRRELVDSLAFSAAGSAGRLGLTAPPTQLAGRVTSRPGLQDGPATGLGFAARNRNIFTAQPNRLIGANGRCQDLASAGFFGGSRAGCERDFHR